jgi:hypothetical protein
VLDSEEERSALVQPEGYVHCGHTADKVGTCSGLSSHDAVQLLALDVIDTSKASGTTPRRDAGGDWVGAMVCVAKQTTGAEVDFRSQFEYLPEGVGYGVELEYV